MSAALQIIAILAIPGVVHWFGKRVSLIRTLGPVMFCYAVGIAWANIPGLSPDLEISKSIFEGAVVLAIPLLLFSLDVKGWVKVAGPAMLSFVAAVTIVVFVAAGVSVAFEDHLAESAKIAGMMVGVYTGGTPNMAAIGTALKVQEETLVVLNGADMLVGAVYFFFLIGPAGALFGRFLKPYVGDKGAEASDAAVTAPKVGHYALGIGLSAAVVGIAVGVGALFTGPAQGGAIIIALTTLAIGASMIARIRALPGTEAAGNYVLLVFCVAMGSTANLARLIEGSGILVLFVATVLLSSVILHLIFCFLLGIDRDTVIITSTAAIFGPPFVPPVAQALGNRAVLLSGMTTGVLGLAVGNYLGLALHWVLS